MVVGQMPSTGRMSHGAGPSQAKIAVSPVAPGATGHRHGEKNQNSLYPAPFRVLQTKLVVLGLCLDTSTSQFGRTSCNRVVAPLKTRSSKPSTSTFANRQRSGATSSIRTIGTGEVGSPFS